MISHPVFRFFFGSLRRQLITGVALVHAVMMSLFVWDMTIRQKDMLLERQNEHAAALSRTLATSAAVWLAAHDVAGLQELVNSQRHYPELLFAMITNPEKLVLAHTDRSRIGQRVTDLPHTPHLTVLGNSIALVDIAVPVYLDNKWVGWIRIGIGQKASNAKLNRITRDGIMYALLAIVTGTLAAWYMGRKTSSRLYLIQKTMERIKTGDRGERTLLSGDDEAAHLGREFDHLLDTIAERERELREMNSHLEALVEERTEKLNSSLARAIFSENELKTAQRVAHVGSWSLEIPAEKFVWSDETHDIFGISRDTPMTLELLFTRIHPDDLDMVTEKWSAAMAGAPYDTEHRIVSGDAVKWVNAKAKFIFDSQGAPLSAIGTVQDITRSKTAELETVRQKEDLENVLNALADPFYVINAEDFSIELANPAARRIKGLPCVDLTASDRIIFRHDCPDICPLEVTRRSGTPLKIDHVIPDEQGEERYVELHCYPIVDDTERVIKLIVYTVDITERKKAVSMLAESQTRLELAIRSANMGTWSWDIRRNLRTFDEQTCYLLGLDHDTFEGTAEEFFSAIHPDDRDHVRTVQSRILNEGGNYEVEYRVVWPDDSIHFICVRGRLTKDEYGEPEFIKGVAWDVTARKVAEQELQKAFEETNRLNRLMQGRETRIVELKSEINHLCDELGREHAYSAARAENRIIFTATDDVMVKPVNFEQLMDSTLWQRILDRFCDVMGVAAAILEPNGKILVASRWRRICTGFHRVREESAKNCLESDTVLASRLTKREKYAFYTCQNGLNDAASPVILDGIHVANVFVGQFLTSPADREYFVNQAQRFGYDQSEYLQALEEVPVLDERSIHDILELLCALTELIASTASHAYRFRESVERLKASAQLVSLAEDAERARIQAEAASRSKSSFLANMSHEIRTPLNGIIGLTYLMLASCPDPKQKDYLSKIYSSSKSLLAILNDILDYSKIEAEQLHIDHAPFLIDNVLTRVSDVFSVMAEEKGLELSFEVTPSLPSSFIGDELRLGQVLNNLVGNAIKFTHQGEIHVKAELVEEADGEFLALFTVRDTGIGISGQHIDKLFQAFSQVDGSTTRTYGGTGLGLSISRKLIELMGGTIRVDSAPGKGSTFSFTVPLNVAHGASEARNYRNLRGMRTLIADDHDTTRMVLEQILTSWGFDVTSVSSGDGARDIIQREARAQRPFELLLLDWKMPGLDGLEVAMWLNGEIASGSLLHTPIRIIMVTTFGREYVSSMAKTIHPDAILSKPVTSSDLFDVIISIQKGSNHGEEANEPIRPGNPLEKIRPIQGARALLVEDNQVNQQVAGELLKIFGLNVNIASTGREAVEMVDTGEYDLVLMDVQMPEMDGYEATKILRSCYDARQLPIIAMTAAALKEDREACLACGMNDHIAKPLDPDQLQAALRRWIPARHPDRGEAEQRRISRHDEGAPFTLRGFDLEEAAARMQGNWNALRRALESFAGEFRDSGTTLTTLLENGNITDATILAHSIKGAAANLGARRLAKLAGTLEAELKTGAPTSPQMFRDQLNAAIAAIRGMERAPVRLADYDREVVTELLTDIEATIKHHRIVPLITIDKLCGMLAGSAADDPARKLKRQLDRFAYEEAAATIHTIAGILNLTIGNKP